MLWTVTVTPPPDQGLWGDFIERGKFGNPEDAGVVGGWLKNELQDAFSWLGKSFMDYIGPFVNWGSRIIIVSCFIIYFISGEKKYIAAALKWGIVFLLYMVISGAVG